MERRTLVAPDGMLYTDNKKTYGKIILLADEVDEEDFFLISNEEYERKIQNGKENGGV